MSFLRSEATICGTSTTGTGTLTLAACPHPPGGVDLYAAFTGQGLGTSQSTPAPYVVMEYTDSTFTVAKQMEKGVGALTLGASVTATTLARTTVQVTATSMNSAPTYNTAGPSAITIGTAANVLVFIGASAADVQAFTPYFDTTGDNLGVGPTAVFIGNSASPTCTPNVFVSGGADVYVFFDWRTPMLVKRCSVNVSSAGSGGNSNADARLYAINSSGRPGKLLYDFGLLGTANTTFHSTGNVSTGAAGSGFFLQPGEYVLDLCDVETDTVHAALVAPGLNVAMVIPSRIGSTSIVPWMCAHASSPVIGAAPDPANVTSYTADSGTVSTKKPFIFTLASS